MIFGGEVSLATYYSLTKFEREDIVNADAEAVDAVNNRDKEFLGGSIDSIKSIQKMLFIKLEVVCKMR